jgi:glycosyltransferase involved in cell wall biosynthesis
VYATAACRELNVPLVVHFHGFDAHANSVIDEFGARYRKMFAQASAIIAVSRPMVRQLASLGAPDDKIHYIPYGVDCEQFFVGQPNRRSPILLAVGRFVDKKAPHLTLAAFRAAHELHPELKLRMIGEGPLLDVCQDLARLWKLDEAVTFLGAQPHHLIQEEMSRAYCFVQHSVVARSGDSEGMPVAIIEAGACGLPVIATRHAGIPEVVIEGETGLLVDEGDVAEMTKQMCRVAAQPELAARLGTAARQRIKEQFRMDQSIDRLWATIQSCIEERDECRS